MPVDPLGVFEPAGPAGQVEQLDPFGVFEPARSAQDPYGYFESYRQTPVEQGFFKKIAESFGRGRENTLADVAVYESLTRNRGALRETLTTRKKLLKQQFLNPIEANFLTDIVYSGARTAGQVWESSKRGGKGAIIGGATGAAVAATAGLLLPTIGEEVPLALAGAKIGIKLGAAEGAALFSYKQGVGNIFADLLEQGTDPRLAEIISKVAGIPYALIEVLQLKGLTPSLKNMATAALSKTTSKLLAQAVKRYGKTLTQEVIEEIGQEIIQIGAEDVAKVLGKQGIYIDAQYIKERGKRLLDVTTQSAKSFALLPVPGAVIEAGINIESANMAREIAAAKEIFRLKGKPVYLVTPEDVTSPIMKVAVAAKNSAIAYEEQERLRKAERAKRFGEAQTLRENITDETWKAKVKSTLKGKYPAVGIEPLSNQLPLETFLALDQEIRTSSVLDVPETVNLSDAMETLFKEGKILRPFELDMVEKQWGVGIRQMLTKIAPKVTFMDYLSLPKATSASIDLSRTLRQNMLLMGDPKVYFKGAVTDMHLFLEDEHTARLLEKSYLTALEQKGNLLQKTGVRWNEWGAGANYTKGTEKFASRLGGKIPGIARSERAYSMGGNAIRALKILEIAEARKGTITTPAQWRNIGHIINILSGEGDPKTFGRYAPALNAVFFAPRLLQSRFEAIISLAHLGRWLDPKWRPAMKILAYHVASAVGINLGILGLASLVPGVDVEKDPRSTDFGKIRIGNTRIDFWGGYLPMARLIIRLAYPYRKTAAGEIVKAEYYDTITSFLQSKLGPAPGFVLDVLRGQTFYGDYAGIEAESLIEQFYHRFIPFFIQDTMDAIKYQGWATAGATAPLAFFGAGVQSYPLSPGTESLLQKNELSMTVLGRKWSDLGPDAQQLMQQQFPEIEMSERKARFSASNYSWLTRVEKERGRTVQRFYKTLPRDVQKEFDSLNIKPLGISRTISNDWYLNDKQYEKYKRQTETLYKDFLSSLIRQDWWPRVPETLKISIITELMNDIKESVRKLIIEQANVHDLEQILTK